MNNCLLDYELKRLLKVKLAQRNEMLVPSVHLLLWRLEMHPELSGPAMTCLAWF